MKWFRDFWEAFGNRNLRRADNTLPIILIALAYQLEPWSQFGQSEAFLLLGVFLMALRLLAEWNR